jgi:hypothetical protein
MRGSWDSRLNQAMKEATIGSKIIAALKKKLKKPFSRREWIVWI